MLDLEKVDQIVARTGVTFEQAARALEQANNDVVQAIIILENNKENIDDKIKMKTSDILNAVKEIIKEGNATHITVYRNGKVILDLPILFGAVGVVLAPLAALLGTGAAFIYNCKIVIEKKDGTDVEVIDYIKAKFDSIKK